MPPKSNKPHGQVARKTTVVEEYHKNATPPKGRSTSTSRPESSALVPRGRTRSRSQSRGRSESAGTLAVVHPARPNAEELEERKVKADTVKAIIGYAKAKYTTVNVVKKKKEYSEATRTATRQMFVATILAAGPTLNEIHQLMKTIKSALTTDGKLNTSLIAQHLEALIALTKTYTSDESHDKVATQIVNKMRHITEQLRNNSVIFEVHSMGQENFTRYLDSLTSISKTAPHSEVMRYIVGDNFNTDKLAFASANAKFSVIANNSIFSEISEMSRYIKPPKPTKQLNEWIQETHESRYAMEDKIEDKKHARIEARHLRVQDRDTSHRAQKSEIRAARTAKSLVSVTDLTTDKEMQFLTNNSQLSTAALLLEMQSMQLAI